MSAKVFLSSSTQIIMENNKIATNIVLDLGKNEVKGFSFTSKGEILKKVNFDSVIRKHLTPIPLTNISNPNKYKIELNGKYFEIGDGIVKGSYCNNNTKLTEHHKLCMLVGIGLLVEGEAEFVNLLVGLPSSHIYNSEEKRAFEDLLKGEEGKKIVININGETKTFVINSVTPDSEGLAIIPRLKLMMENNQKNIGVIDIGGHNVNLRKFAPLGHALDEMGVSGEQIGTNQLISSLTNAIRSSMEDRDRSLTKEDVKRFIKNGTLDDDIVLKTYAGTNQDFVKEFVENYISEKIIEFTTENEFRVFSSGEKYIFAGGGSNLLKPYIENILKRNKENIYFSETAKWDNCLSYAINYLFKINPDRIQVFNKILDEYNLKLTNEDKSVDFNNINLVANILG